MSSRSPAAAASVAAPYAQRRRPVGRRLRRALAPYGLLLPASAVIAAVLAYPLYYLVRLSFQHYGLFQLVRHKGVAIGTANYAQIFHDSCTLDYHPDGNAERLDVPAAFAEVAAITSLGSVPMVVVTADTHPYAGLDATEEAHLDEVWNEGQQQWAALSSTGHVVPVGNTSHHIQVDQPAIVVEQIRNLSR